MFVLARRLLPPAGRPVGALLAAGLYACTVTAIQHAHFFTVESWLVCATLATFLLALHAAAPTGRPGLPLGRLAALGAAVGLTLACKVSGGIVLLPAALALAVLVRRAEGAAARAVGAAAAALVTLAAADATFRLVSPYSFEHASWLELAPNHDLRASLASQQDAINGTFLFPPSYQWLLRRPLLDPLHDEVVWGLGPPLGVAALAGLACLAVDLVRARRGLVPARLADGQAALAAGMLLLFVAATFGYFGSRFAASLRYLVPMVPFLGVAAAYGLVRAARRRSPAVARRRWRWWRAARCSTRWPSRRSTGRRTRGSSPASGSPRTSRPGRRSPPRPGTTGCPWARPRRGTTGCSCPCSTRTTTPSCASSTTACARPTCTCSARRARGAPSGGCRTASR